MNGKVESFLISFNTWQIRLFSVIGAVLITNLSTALISLGIWRTVRTELLVLGTINAVLVPLIMLPLGLRLLRRTLQLEEQNQAHMAMRTKLENQSEMELGTQRRAEEMSLLYQLGILFAAGKDLYETLLILQSEIVKLAQVDILFVAIYDEKTDIVDYPIFFRRGDPQSHVSRKLSDRPGLTGAVVYGKQTLYLPDMLAETAMARYAPVGDPLLTLRTFLGIPLVVNHKVIGALAVQSAKPDAYSRDQIQLIENMAVQAATAIDKARLLDQLKQQLREREHVETQLREREAILEAVTFAAEQFLKMPDWRANIDQVLERLGKTLHVTHAYLFEDHIDAQGELVTSMRYEWTAPGYPSDLEGPYFQNSKVHQEGYETQLEALRRGEVRTGTSSTFNPIEKEAMDEFGVKALLEVPVFVHEKEWGAMGFDDFAREREWSNAEVEALKIAAGVLSAAIQRQEVEAAVRESERIYRQAIEAAGAVPYYRDYRLNRYSFIGAGIQKMTGYLPEEMSPALWVSIVQEVQLIGDLAGLDEAEAVRRVRNGEFEHWKCDYRILAKDGQSKWIADRGIELFEDTGSSHSTIGIMQDITERKQIEAGLRQREAMLQAITFAAEQFLRASNWREQINAVLERLGREFNASHAYLFERHRGPNDEILSSMTYEWTAPECVSDLDDPAFQNLPLRSMGFERLYEILDRGEPLVGSSSFFKAAEREYVNSINVKALLEMRIIVDSQQWGTLGFDDVLNERDWTLMEVDVIRVASNVLGAAIKRQSDEAALQNELDERQRLIEELELRNAESETLRESTAIVAETLEPSEAVDRILEQLARVVAYDNASVQLLRGEALEIVSFRGRDPHYSDPGMRFLLNANEPSFPVIQGHAPYILYDNVQAAIPAFNDIPHNNVHAWMAVPLRVKGRILGIIALDGYEVAQFSERDANLAVTYANQAAIALENARLFSELQAKYAERQTLVNELESKNTELERFTYTVSHDLKSPLVTITGFLGYLEQDALLGNTERMKGDIRRIDEAVKKMQKLLNELLELSRIGRVVNPPLKVPFGDLVREAVLLVRGQLEARGVRVWIHPNLPVVYVDKPRLVEVLQNLLDNAAKYSGDQPQPQIQIGQRGEQDGQPVFYVSDNGMGIEPEFHERIFGLFNKLDPKTEGTGVGLALVKRIIEVHSGRIWVESEPGHGATFLFTLPTQPQPKSVI
jgi:PAS domain S-box-containing protein